MHYCPNGAPVRWLRMGTGLMGTQAALTTILYVYDTPDNNRTRTLTHLLSIFEFVLVLSLSPPYGTRV